MSGPFDPYDDDEYGDDKIWSDSNGGHPDDSIWGFSTDESGDHAPF